MVSSISVGKDSNRIVMNRRGFYCMFPYNKSLAFCKNLNRGILIMSQGFNHFDENGNAVMVDVSAKEITERIAVASGKIHVNREVMEAIVNHTAKKGDVLTVARVAGIMATKQTSNLIPMCHPLCLNKCTVEFEVDEENGSIQTWCTVKVSGKTGVEMEALMGVNVALLTIYDMCKAMDRAMEIFDVHLEKKDGGKSGLFERSKEREQC